MSINFSVLMTVYAKEKPEFLSTSLESIWNAQSLKPSQIVLVKDGPLTPQLESVISSWCDKIGDKFKVVALKMNSGLARALNFGLSYCDCEYIARMDSDDASTPNRFYKQVDFALKNPDVDCFSSWVAEYDENLSSFMKLRKVPLSHFQIREFCKTRNPLSHPAVFFKKKSILEVGSYPNVYPEDYFLWFRLIDQGYKLANLPDILVYMRTGKKFIARRGFIFLKGEITIYLSMYSVGFISISKLVTNILGRSVVRLSPPFVKNIFYKYFRS